MRLAPPPPRTGIECFRFSLGFKEEWGLIVWFKDSLVLKFSFEIPFLCLSYSIKAKPSL